eukprot:6487628-Amphidinium_carterae.1
MKVPEPPKRAGFYSVFRACLVLCATQVQKGFDATFPTALCQYSTWYLDLPCHGVTWKCGMNDFSRTPLVWEDKHVHRLFNIYLHVSVCQRADQGTKPGQPSTLYALRKQERKGVFVHPMDRAFACCDWLPSCHGHRGGVHTPAHGNDLTDNERRTISTRVSDTTTLPLNVCVMDGSEQRYNLLLLDTVDWFSAEEPISPTCRMPSAFVRPTGEIYELEAFRTAFIQFDWAAPTHVRTPQRADICMICAGTAHTLNTCEVDGSDQHYNLARLDTVDWFAAEEDPSPHFSSCIAPLLRPMEEVNQLAAIRGPFHAFSMLINGNVPSGGTPTNCQVCRRGNRGPDHNENRGGAQKRSIRDASDMLTVLDPAPQDSPDCLFYCLCRLIGKEATSVGVTELRLLIATKLSHLHMHSDCVAMHSIKQWATSLGYDSVCALIKATHLHPHRMGSALDLHVVHLLTGITIWVYDVNDHLIFALGESEPEHALRLAAMHYKLVRLNDLVAAESAKKLRRIRDLCADKDALVREVLVRHLRARGRVMTVASHIPVWHIDLALGLIKGAVIVHAWQAVCGSDSRIEVHTKEEVFHLNFPEWTKFACMRLEVVDCIVAPPSWEDTLWPLVQDDFVEAVKQTLLVEDPRANLWQRTQFHCLRAAICSQHTAQLLERCWCAHVGDNLTAWALEQCHALRRVPLIKVSPEPR